MPPPQQLVLLAILPLCLALFFQSQIQEVAQTIWSTWSSSAVAPIVVLPQGKVVGKVLDHHYPEPIEGFMGLPYAQPPTGDRRFRRAVPLPPSSTTYKATHYGHICPGKQLLAGKANPSSEDCMTVNIFRQKPKNADKLPVAVYIHGGAFNRGSSMMHNTASMVAWSEEPFIGVSFNYRLGALGFLPSKLTFEEDIVNLGLHDQVFLLQWVQDNIEAFGGDKNDVTIFGLSAGAHSIGHHIMNYQEGVKPLFHKAILESGAATSRAQHPYNASVHEEQFSLFLEKAGCNNVADVLVTSCLRSKSEEIIVAASQHVFDLYNPSLRWAFQPVIDHEIIHQRPIDQWTAQKWNKVPIMTGHTTNEGTMYVPSSLSTAVGFRDFWHTLLPHYSEADLATIEALYPDPASKKDSPYYDTRDLTALEIGPQYKRVEAAYAHYAYACPVRQTAQLASPHQEQPVFVYHWAVNKTVKGGANHGDNMYYESFQKSVTDISEATREISGVYHAYVTSFITKGDPNAIRGRYADRPMWESYHVGSEKVMTLGMGNDERAGGSGVGVPAQMADSKWIAKECDFWWAKSYDTEE